MAGQLKSIWIKRMKNGPMDAVEEASLLANKGLVNNADQGGKRQVTIIEEEAWSVLMDELHASLNPSIRRANIMVSGINLYESRGEIIKIGPCKIKIYGETKPCERMEEALPGLKDAMNYQWRGGVYGIVLNDGKIKLGDEVTIS
ncbi:MOSC domain-containing protein [Evansella sp. AB-P1]|uniref:MOSC domain-containing protein n=1 Tax=Evansella sp. AB-P1 TaxID=3037653 RepID=UPI00241F813F|nr:MOSC domain-containing protein [Evansella sp. AB-P1]MDG5789537.1 MOSC domain-containing protein [Evansella sp. AB-P1]